MDRTIEFTLGAASAAFQIEGGWNADGKGESIWDRWLHHPGIGNGTGDIACDHYHRWEEDLEILRRLGVDSYRFSISWPRVLPEGDGELNPAGLAFYKNLLKRLKEYGISAAVTLNHWDLPQALQNRGGWANRDTVYAFEAYAKLMFDTLGEYVDYWITHNEPFVVAALGHEEGRFAPGHRDVAESLLVSHHLLLSHGLAVKAFREGGFPGKIGISLSNYPAQPATDALEDKLAARRDMEYNVGWYADPIFLGRYPEYLWNHLVKKGVVMPRIGEGDMALIHAPIDFLGINYYRTNTLRHKEGGHWPYDNDYVPDVTDKKNPIFHTSPQRMGAYLRYLNDRYAPAEIIISENGYSAPESLDRNGEIRDYYRIDYLYRHLEQCILAKQAGIPIGGYYVWSFLDDLEWTGGYGSRMGLVRVDYDTQKRTIKESGYWYRRVIENRALVD